MKVGLFQGFFGPADTAFIQEAERLGIDSVWTAEAWGYDALTPLAYLAAQTSTIRLGTAIAQIGARTPAMLAMSAMSLQALSGGRFLLGLGVSGPQVMEGWHGTRFEAPVQATRETIEIVRKVASGERLEHDGTVYTLPLPDSQGRALRSFAPPVRVPAYVAAMGPRNLALTGELADGWIGNAFMPEEAGAFLKPLREGAERAKRSLADIDLAIPVAVEFTDDVEEAGRRHAGGYAFTIGAMGSRKRNFYNEAFARQGFGDAVAEVQRLWLAGDRAAAAAAVPMEIGLCTNLLGTEKMIAERLRLHREAGTTTLLVKLDGPAEGRLATLERLVGLVADLS
ncbi:LLM class flavin-dependent oxidoreductase [Actinomadura barringtoniae]|uniref:LLM class flavin-dependent oxidoreductase n=1 Tax=Actinomadura barringtoniae TaxID=1427535 RepID=A0A939T1G1_9ACTN|nr:LLM class flavin-dependent oxidoreductase [Actinomadura barringtoniae]MBO2447486.1 LLM class flavin-dependent oxidoreductase [Actinomadura barringtoniae]